MSVIIRLQNLPMSANAANIRRFFAGLTIPEGGVHIVGGDDGDAFIAFATDEDARKAMLLDRQTINGAAIRLLLSSKTEMQTVIESARSSVLLSGVPITGSSNSKTDTIKAMDVSSPSLPSSFSSYQNGNRNDRGYMVGYGEYPREFEQTGEPNYREARPPRELEHPRHDRAGERNIAHDDHRDFYDYSHPPTKQRRFEDSRPEYGAGLVRSPLPNYRTPYGDFDYSHERRPPIPNDTYSHDLPERSSCAHPANDFPPPRTDAPDVPRPDIRHRSPPRGRPFFHQDTRDPRNQNMDMDRGFGPRPFPEDRRQYYPDTLPYGPPRPHEERDFSIRPPWLNETIAPKRLPPRPPPDLEEYQRKRKPFNQVSDANMSEIKSGDTEFVARVSLHPSDVHVKTIFELLRGVQIVAKWGIRMEEDALHRPTGYVFIMTTTRDSLEKALTYSGRMFRDRKVVIAVSTPAEFYNVTDSNFRPKCPPEVEQKFPPAGQERPPHHADGCLEVSEVPPDATKAEIVSFIGAPGLTVDDVVLAQPPHNSERPVDIPTIKALVKLPSAGDIDILLSAKPRPLRPNSGLPPVSLVPISKLQFEAFSEDRKDISAPHSFETERSVQSPVAGPTTCAYLSGLSRPLREAEVLQFFPSVLIPGDAVRLIAPENTTALIDFISEKNCKRAVEDISAESKAMKAHPDLHLEPITRCEMENRLNESKTEDHDRPPRTRDRDSRPPWEGPRQSRFPPSDVAHGHLQRQYDESVFELTDDEYVSGASSAPLPKPLPQVDRNDILSSQSNFAPALPGRTELLPTPNRRPPRSYPTVFISSLPSSVTVDQLADVLRDYYFVPGSIRFRRDNQGQPTGEAMVDFESNYEADRVLREMNGFRFAGRPMVLRYDHRA